MDSTRLAQLVAKVLKEELREDENTREQSLEQFRDWIRKNPDIRDCPTDDSFLLPYLRVRKYSVPMAEQTLMKLLKFKHNFPELHRNLDIEDPDMNDVFSSGYAFSSPLPDTNGRTVSMMISRNFDLEKHSYQTAMRTLLLFTHHLAFNEASLALGLTVILDYSRTSPAYFALTPITVLKALTDSFEKSFPVRMKQVIVVNLPPVAVWVFRTFIATFSEKLRERFLFQSSLEELHKYVDPSVLPKEYGGTMLMEEMVGKFKKELAVHREAILAVNNIKLVGDSFKNDLGSNETGISDLQGSFRKLDVD